MDHFFRYFITLFRLLLLLYKFVIGWTYHWSFQIQPFDLIEYLHFFVLIFILLDMRNLIKKLKRITEFCQMKGI